MDIKVAQRASESTEPGKVRGQQKDESAMDYLRRVVSNLNYEPETLLDSLPTIEAVVDYFGLFHVYDTDCMGGIEECIHEGDDPAPLRDFVKRHRLDWDLTWIKTARIAIAKATA